MAHSRQLYYPPPPPPSHSCRKPSLLTMFAPGQRNARRWWHMPISSISERTKHIKFSLPSSPPALFNPISRSRMLVVYTILMPTAGLVYLGKGGGLWILVLRFRMTEVCGWELCNQPLVSGRDQVRRKHAHDRCCVLTCDHNDTDQRRNRLSDWLHLGYLPESNITAKIGWLWSELSIVWLSLGTCLNGIYTAKIGWLWSEWSLVWLSKEDFPEYGQPGCLRINM